MAYVDKDTADQVVSKTEQLKTENIQEEKPAKAAKPAAKSAAKSKSAAKPVAKAEAKSKAAAKPVAKTAAKSKAAAKPAAKTAAKSKAAAKPAAKTSAAPAAAAVTKTAEADAASKTTGRTSIRKIAASAAQAHKSRAATPARAAANNRPYRAAVKSAAPCLDKAKAEKLFLAPGSCRFAAPVDYSQNDKYINRELSWLQFDSRVLLEARDEKNPLMERLSFLSITANNLDEFVMVRVASLKDMMDADYVRPDMSGLNPEEQLVAIAEQTHALVDMLYDCYKRELLPALREAGIHILSADDLSEQQSRELDKYFTETVYPILTPMAVDSSRPFPLINNKSLNICALLSKDDDDDEDEEKFVTMQLPGVIPRLYRFNAPGKNKSELCFITLEDLILMKMEEIFPGAEILASGVYRIMRNADLDIDEEEADDLLLEIEKQIRMRRWGEVIRLEIQLNPDKRLQKILIDNLNIDMEDIYMVDGPLDLTVLSKLRSDSEIKRHAEWYYKPYTPQQSGMLAARTRKLQAEGIEHPDMFSIIRKGSVLLHHPYESFDPVLEFIKQAASDPDVLAIKQTLYRISGSSPIISYLEEAAKNGKQVLVLVELKARFDEENNIQWARRLEKAGCHVIYGLVGLKTHSKITLVVRRDPDGIRRYLHLGTGNYNDQTAKLYTDMGYFVTRHDLGEDATEFFNMLSGFSEPDYWHALVAAPLWMRSTFEELIRREIAFAQKGSHAAIKAKMNSLVDEGMIDLLYEASQAGVEVDLIVRGICCLRPGVPGLSENIRVRSLVGRYLEHTRIYMFHNEGKEDVYLSSADWMTRNLSRRVELLFPIFEDDCRDAVKEVMDLQYRDTERAHIMQPDGSYKKFTKRTAKALDSQKASSELAMARAPRPVDVMETRVFEPIMAPAEEEELVVEAEHHQDSGLE